MAQSIDSGKQSRFIKDQATRAAEEAGFLRFSFATIFGIYADGALNLQRQEAMRPDGSILPDNSPTPMLNSAQEMKAGDEVLLIHYGSSSVALGRVSRSDDKTFAALENYLPLTGGKLTGNLTLEGSAPDIKWHDTDDGAYYWWHANSGKFFLLQDRNNDGSWDTPHPMVVEANGRITFGVTPQIGTDLVASRGYVSNNYRTNTYIQNNYLPRSGGAMDNGAIIIVRDSGNVGYDIGGRSGTTGIAVRARVNPASGQPIFSVLSSGGTERLKVEHNGYTRVWDPDQVALQPVATRIWANDFFSPKINAKLDKSGDIMNGNVEFRGKTKIFDLAPTYSSGVYKHTGGTGVNHNHNLGRICRYVWAQYAYNGNWYDMVDGVTKWDYWQPSQNALRVVNSGVTRNVRVMMIP